MARSSRLRVRLSFLLGLVVVSMLSHYVVDATGVVCQANTSAIRIPAEDNAGSDTASQNTTALHTGFLPPPVIATVTGPAPMSLILGPVARSSLISLTLPLLPPR
jgi:hypothetical protein